MDPSFSIISPREAYNKLFASIVVLDASRQSHTPDHMYPGSVGVNLCDCESNHKLGRAFSNAYKECVELYGPDDPQKVLLFCDQETVDQSGMSLSDLGGIVAASFNDNGITSVNSVALVERQRFCLKYEFLFEDATFQIYPNEIEELLFLGSAGCVQNVAKLGITSVLTLTEKNVQIPSCIEFHLHYNIADSLSADMATALDSVLPWIDEQHSNNRKVLVHCEQGQSRSVTAVVAYLCQSKSLKWYDALAIVKGCRPTSSASLTLTLTLTITITLTVHPNPPP
jgi:hypothetical protein